MNLLRSLSGRLLVVTLLVVMLAEVAIFVPSIAQFRQSYLLERVHRAEIAALTVFAAPNGMVGDELERLLIQRTGVLNVVMQRNGARQMVLSSPGIPPIAATFDLRDPPLADSIWQALRRLFVSDGGVIRVIANPPDNMGAVMEVTLETAPLAKAMRAYALKILLMSLLISLATGVMVFFAVRRAVVRPIQKLIGNIKRFARAPDDTNRIMAPASRVGEVAEAERAVAEMQRDVAVAFAARSRLASLGEAVAKISHDLRNILGTTQLMADRLETSRDPIVARTAPKLIASLDRAIRLCQSTLAYGKAEEAPPEPRAIVLTELVDEVFEGLGLVDTGTVAAIVSMDRDLIVEADPEHLYRVLSNLARNAAEAIRASGGPGRLTIAAERAGERIDIRVIDTGPGLPAQARENLFKAFKGGTRTEGTGLGLAIAAELVRANGGTLELASSTTAGTEFRITLPSRTAVLESPARNRLAIVRAER